MLLTLTTTHDPATDLGFLLHKNPSRAQSFPLSFGQAHVFYPEASTERCTAALLLDVDPVGLVRQAHAAGRGGEGASLGQYVNDRPYVGSSFLSVAIAQVYGSALAGHSRERPELVEQALPLEATLAVVACRGGEGFVRRLFEPLGYALQAQRHPLDTAFAEWGESHYLTLTLRATTTLRRLLSHLYVLVPVLDDDKHYWVGGEEVEKLLRHGEGWLAAHPEREQIARRYLRHQGLLTRDALERLVEEDAPDPDATADAHAAEEAAVEGRIGLDVERRAAVVAALKAAGARRVIDLGCGEGKLLQALLQDPAFAEVAGMDVSVRALARAERRLEPGVTGSPPAAAAPGATRLRLFQGTLTYRDRRIEGYDAAAVVEVIEHLDRARLRDFERVLFGAARPRTVVLTTPNVEYNARFEALPAGTLRHRDHQFEWTRAEFEGWARGVAARHGYAVRFQPVGPEDAALGAPTQMGVFDRE